MLNKMLRSTIGPVFLLALVAAMDPALSSSSTMNEASAEFRKYYNAEDEFSSVSQLALHISNRLDHAAEAQRQFPFSSSADAVEVNKQHHRSLMDLDFITICSELRIIFHDKCSCAEYDAEESDRIDCTFNGMHALAHFNQYDLTLSRMQVCRGPTACIALHYSNDMALFCEATSMHDEICDCHLCQAGGGDFGMLGLNVSCPDGTLTTQGCELASSVLDLGEWKPPLTKGAKAGISMGVIIGVTGLAGLVFYFIRRKRRMEVGKESDNVNDTCSLEDIRDSSRFRDAAEVY